MTPQELKNSILQLAIQGRLVSQRPEEGTAEELYRQIQREKAALVKAGKIKKEKPLPEITEEEVPFEIPEGWKWVRWGDLSLSIQYGYNAPAQQTGRIKMVRISDIQDGKVLWDSVPYCDISEDEIAEYLLQKNDILFARTGGTVGKSFLVKTVPEESIYAGYLIRTRYSNLLCPEYMKSFMESQLYWNQLKSGTIATAQPNCNGKTLSKMILPLPPLAEQKRIVAKIEELLPYIDRYEKAWSRLEDFNKRFPTDMQKSILQLAIQGKLVPQRPEEGTGAALYRQIQAEKQSLIRSGKLKKEKPLPEITDEEIPFEIPESWIWVRLDDILLAMGAGKSIRCNEVVPEDGQPGIIKVSAVTWGEFAENESKTCLSQTDWIEDYRIIAGDFLISRANTKKLVGACVIVNNIQKKLMLSDKILRLRFSGHLDLFYLLFAMRSASTREQIEAMATGTSDSMKNISQKGIRRLIVPLPPLAEQKRIVAKLEELLPLCKRLK